MPHEVLHWCFNVAHTLIAAFVLVFSVVPFDAGEPLEESVDVLEVNQVWNLHVADNGWQVNWTPSLRQLIFRETDWQGPHIVDWKLWNEQCIPMQDHKGKFILWNDNSAGGSVLRRVRFKIYEPTDSGWDNESIEREEFPVEWRRKLRTK